MSGRLRALQQQYEAVYALAKLDRSKDNYDVGVKCLLDENEHPFSQEVRDKIYAVIQDNKTRTESYSVRGFEGRMLACLGDAHMNYADAFFDIHELVVHVYSFLSSKKDKFHFRLTCHRINDSYDIRISILNTKYQWSKKTSFSCKEILGYSRSDCMGDIFKHLSSFECLALEIPAYVLNDLKANKKLGNMLKKVEPLVKNGCPKIKTIVLEGIFTLSPKNFQELHATFPQVTHVDFRYVKYDFRGLTSFAYLEEVSVDFDFVTADTLKNLENLLKERKNITSLVLCGNNIKCNADLRQAFGNLKQLWIKDFWSNHIPLSDLAVHAKALEILKLTGSSEILSNKDIDEALRNLQFPQLKVLDLSHQYHLTPEGLAQFLENNTQLSAVILTEKYEREVASIQEKYPQLKIAYTSKT